MTDKPIKCNTCDQPSVRASSFTGNYCSSCGNARDEAILAHSLFNLSKELGGEE